MTLSVKIKNLLERLDKAILRVIDNLEKAQQTAAIVTISR